MPAGAPIPQAPVTTVAGAIARMQAIGAGLPASDGLACFNRMYLAVTQTMDSELGQGFFADPAFMTSLDVTFANLYFAAAQTAGTPAAVPGACRPLVELRGAAGIEPIQFALAGMNAHINHDLPVAVATTCTELGTAPSEGRPGRLPEGGHAARRGGAGRQESFESTPEWRWTPSAGGEQPGRLLGHQLRQGPGLAQRPDALGGAR